VAGSGELELHHSPLREGEVVDGGNSMRTLPVAVIVGAFAFGTCLSAQDKPTPKPTYTSEAMLKRIRDGGAATADRADAVNCVLPDKTERPVNTAVTVAGRTYRCVEVLDENFQRRGVAWTPVAPQP
jgi:hypothetical protein